MGRPTADGRMLVIDVQVPASDNLYTSIYQIRQIAETIVLVAGETPAT